MPAVERPDPDRHGKIEWRLMRCELEILDGDLPEEKSSGGALGRRRGQGLGDRPGGTVDAEYLPGTDAAGPQPTSSTRRPGASGSASTIPASLGDSSAANAHTPSGRTSRTISAPRPAHHRHGPKPRTRACAIPVRPTGPHWLAGPSDPCRQGQQFRHRATMAFLMLDRSARVFLVWFT